MLDAMFEIPGSDITLVSINEDVVMGKQEPIYTRVAKNETVMKDSQETEYMGAAQAINS